MDWAYGQPDQYIHGKKRFLVPIPPVPREEDCVGMRFKDWGHWHDVPCDRPFISPYICEYGREYFLQKTKFCCWEIINDILITWHWHDKNDISKTYKSVCSINLYISQAPTTHVPTKTTSVTMTPLASTTTPTRHGELN